MMSEREPLAETALTRWESSMRKEVALMGDLLPLLKKRTGGGEIAGLKAYEE